VSAIARDQVEEISALSPAQEGIFFHTALDPDRAPYVEQSLWRIHGTVDPELFERAWNAVIEQHGILRTVFRQARRQAVQIVLKGLSVGVPHHDLRALGNESALAALASLAADERMPFKLADGPLQRLVLVRLADDEWRLIWTFHHIILDGVTSAIVLRSLCSAYDALAAGRSLPPAAPSFGRFLTWLSQQDRDAALAYWGQRLETFQTPTVLPYDRRNAAGGDRRTVRAWLDAPTTKALHEMARRHRVTAVTLTQAAWAILLGRYGRTTDVVFGVTVAGRPTDLDGVDSIAGPFISTMPVRVELSSETRVSRILREILHQVASLEQHGHVSLADVQARSGVRRPLPLFDSVVNVHPLIDWNGFRAQSFVLGPATEHGAQVGRTNYDLMVDVAMFEQTSLAITYSDAAFDEATVRGLLGNLQATLGELASLADDAAVVDIASVSSDERHRLLHEIGDGGPPPAFAGGVVARIEKQAQASPQALAVVSGGDRRTYEALNAQANRIAWSLRAAGFGREDRIGVFGDRNADWLTFVLGVLKAGAAFVPFDPLQPDARLARAVSASGIGLLACGPESLERGELLVDAMGLQAIPWDRTPVDSQSTGNPTAMTEASDLACIFFTSGSSGIPKGVMVEHWGLNNHILAKIDRFGIDASSVVAQTASLGFDISVWQMFAALEVGGTVVVYSDAHLDASVLMPALERDGVTLLETVPNLIDGLIDASTGISLPRLRCLMSNADVLPPAMCRRWLTRFPDVPIANTYGITETSDDTTHLLMAAPPADDSQRVAVGRPIEGARLYLLDKNLRLVPIAGLGEIAVSGVPVGRGYLDDPVKTAQVFVPDPHSGVPGSRMYLTGDTGRWRADGALEYVGRDGEQVKVHGRRVELGEVRAAILAYPGVRQAAAIITRDATDDPRIVAYWVGEAAVDYAQLREALSAVLPAGMMPAALVRLDALPLNQNGKLDRSALPEVELSPARQAYEAPSGTVESAIARVWGDVLGIERVGRDDVFFELGGQSLRSLQVRARLVEAFGVEIPLREIFRTQTVREQAVLVSEALRSRELSAPIPRLGDSEAFALSRAQRRLWFMQALEPEGTFYNILAPIVIEGGLDARAFERAFARLAERHEALRTTFTVVDGEPMQRVGRIIPAVKTVDLSSLPEHERRTRLGELLRSVKGEPFTFDTPPVRAVLVHLAEGRHLFALALHHIVSDAWSGNVMLRDLLQIYRAESGGGSLHLPALPIRYVDYAAWHNARLESGAMADDERYWLEQLAGNLPVLDLPAGDPSKHSADGRQHVLTITIDGDTAEGLRRAAADYDVTPFMWQLALVKSWLVRVTGADDVLVGSPVAGRHRAELEDLAGFFINLLPLRTSLNGALSFRQVTELVKQTCLDGYAHQDYPFDEIVRRVNPERHLSRLPLIDVMFVAGREGGPVSVEGLTVGAPEAANTEAVTPGVSAPVPLLAVCMEGSDRELVWSLTFDSARFTSEVAAREAARFEVLLRAIAREPNAPLDTLPILAAHERDVFEVRRLAGETTFPLAFNQYDMWAQGQLNPGDAVNQVGVSVRLTGRLDVAAFRAAFKAVIARHEALRTYFVVADGAPLSCVAPIDAEIEICERPDLEPQARIDYIEQRGRALGHQPFVLEQAPLFRAELARFSTDDAALILVLHHLILDGFHLASLFEELAEAYARIVERDPSEWALPARQYGDYARWQTARLEAGLLAGHGGHWRRQLRRPWPAMTILPDFEAPAGRTFTTERILRPMPPEVLELAARLGTTPFRTVIAAFAAWLAPMVESQELLLAMPFSTRPAACRETLGFFGNTLPLRCDVTDDLPFEQLVQVIVDRVRHGRPNSDFPLLELLRGSSGSRDADRPLFPVCVTQVRTIETTTNGLTLKSNCPRVYGSVFDLWLVVSEGEDRGAPGEIQWLYATELFRRETVEAWADALTALLTVAAAQPAAAVGTLRVAAATASPVQAWGRGAPGVTEPSVMETLAAQVAHTPAAVAVAAGDSEWTYSELWAATGKVTTALRAAGIGREARVGLVGTRSPEMVAALLGAWAAGAAVVPLEEAQPDVRLADQARAAGLTWLLSDAATAPRMARLLPDVPVRPWDEWAASEATPFQLAVPDPHDLAYVFFTSGSTGQPKGVMVEQAGLRNHLAGKIAVCGLTAASAVAQTASAGFDICIWQWVAPLLVGGRTVIVDTATAAEPGPLLSALAATGVTVLETVPTFLEAIVAEAETTTVDVPTLAIVIAQAEPLPPAICARWQARFPHALLINAYGLTECSDDTLHGVVPPLADSTRPARVSVGTPMAGVTVAIVDDRLQPVGPGAVGEIVHGGVAVGRGYLHQPGDTAAAFVPDPTATHPGGRWYRTGDRGRWRADGTVECLGRRDHQVKLHGIRVELGDIDAALATVPGLTQVAAAVRTDTRGHRRLVAYYVAATSCDLATLRAHLAARLPAALLPTALIRLAAFPRTRTGKLDRQALPAPDPLRDAVRGEADVAPCEGVARQISEVWQEVLGVAHVGATDNFFDIGGDSIQCIVVVARLRGRGLPTTAKQLYTNPTVESLAAAMEAEQRPQREEPRPAGAVALLPVQRLFLEYGHAVPHHLNVAMLLRAERLDAEALRRALQALLDHHDALRMRFDDSTGSWRQHNPPPGDAVSLEVIDIGDDTGRLAVEGARLQSSMDLRAGPLVRAGLMRLSDGTDRLLLVMHHLVSDAVSSRILLADLTMAYEQTVAGDAIALPARTTSFQRWVEHLERQAPQWLDELPYWQGVQGTGWPPLPIDHDTGPNTMASAAHVRVDLDAETTQILTAHIRQALGVETHEALVAAFARAFGAWANTPTVGFLMERHGREATEDDIDLSRTVGWFTAAHPVRVDAGRGVTLDEHVRRTREALRSVPRGGLGYGLLKYTMKRPELDGELPPVSFNYHGLFSSAAAGTRFTYARESAGPLFDPSNSRLGLIEVWAAVVQGQLRIAVTYSDNRHNRATIEALSDRFASELRAMAAVCQAPPHGSNGGTASERIAAYLQRSESSAELVRCDTSVPTVEQAADALGVPRSAIVKSIVFEHKRDPDRVCLAIVPGDARVSRSKVAAALELQQIRLASASTVERATGYAAGGVPPVGHRTRLPVVVDRRVLDLPVVFGGGGDKEHMLRITPADILRLTSAVVADVTEAVVSESTHA
jgi:Cys-tRNA(Pro) deacylase